MTKELETLDQRIPRLIKRIDTLQGLLAEIQEQAEHLDKECLWEIQDRVRGLEKRVKDMERRLEATLKETKTGEA